MTQPWTAYENFIFTSRYARYLPEFGRRETWDEATARVVDFLGNKVGKKNLPPEDLAEIHTSILERDVMPSMRVMMTAGPALSRDNVAGYNCSYLPIDHPRCFDEMLYILMCGTGVGFSVERQYVNKLPEVADEFYETDSVIQVADSKIGWAKALREYLALLWAGQVPKFDTSKVRPAGSRLNTFGGRASGPEPLEDLFRFAEKVFRGASGRRLTSIECHDLACKIAECVVCGGVRRSALLSLSNLSDERMRYAKHGKWDEANPQRGLSNNSVAYTEQPDMGAFIREWQSLYESRSGERGIFYRPACDAKAAETGRRETGHEWGTNPCSEIILRPHQFCNLTEVVVRAEDSLPDLERKVRIASIIGTIQATFTDFRYLRPIWKKNTEEEALLGVSLTGVYDNIAILDRAELHRLRDLAVATNKEWAAKLGINQAAAVTCVKPSGTVSQLVNSASGMHPRYARHYIRRVRLAKMDPLGQYMIDQGMPHETDSYNPNQWVFPFPIEAPKSATTRDDVSALDQLEMWSWLNRNWCEHKPSVTIYVRENEWMEVGAYVYENFKTLSGVSFLPYDSGTYRQPPYEEVTEEAYREAVSRMPELDFTAFKEVEDNTSGSQELACVAGVCEL